MLGPPVPIQFEMAGAQEIDGVGFKQILLAKRGYDNTKYPSGLHYGTCHGKISVMS